MKTAKFQYKCRLCGLVHSNGCTSEKNAEIILICTIAGNSMPSSFHGMQPQMVELHAGCKMGYGVSDLIGYIVEKDGEKREKNHGERTGNTGTD